VNKGTVKFWNHKKGYGFITPDDGGDDVFVHITALPNKRAVKEGQTLFYTIEKNDKGKFSAANVSFDASGTGSRKAATGNSSKRFMFIAGIVLIAIIALTLSNMK